MQVSVWWCEGAGKGGGGSPPDLLTSGATHQRARQAKQPSYGTLFCKSKRPPCGDLKVSGSRCGRRCQARLAALEGGPYAAFATALGFNLVKQCAMISHEDSSPG